MTSTFFIDLRKLTTYPARSTLIDFIDDEPAVVKARFDAMVAMMVEQNFVLYSYSTNEDGTHKQGLWLSQKDYDTCKENLIQSCRNSMAGITAASLNPPVGKTLYGVLKI